MILIDTNIFLEYLLNNERAGKCQSFFLSGVEKNTEILISRFTLYSIEIIMTEKNLMAELQVFLDSIKVLTNINLVGTDFADDIEIFAKMKKYSLDFDDALQYHIADKYKADIVSYDRHFENIKDIKVITP